MRLEFRPGNLLLAEEPKGNYVVHLEGVTVLETHSRNRAVAKFNSIRREMENHFPPQKQTPEEQAENFRKLVNDGLVGPYSKRTRKKSTAKGTRTFGGQGMAGGESDPHHFDFDLDRGIRAQVVEKLEASPLLPLTKGTGPHASGIYALYFEGQPQPVYIGKASRGTTKSKRTLRARLTEHVSKISAAEYREAGSADPL
jgi:hypothetical protein